MRKYEYWDREAFVKGYLEALEHNLSTRELAASLGVAVSTISNRKTVLERAGVVLPRFKQSVSSKSTDVAYLNALIEASKKRREEGTDETD